MKEIYKNLIVKMINIISSEHKELQWKNNNRCLSCSNSDELNKWADYGLCGICNKFSNCYDSEVAQRYQFEFNLTPEELDKGTYPRLTGFRSIGEYIDAKPFEEMDNVLSNVKLLIKEKNNHVKNINIFDRYVHNGSYYFNDSTDRLDFEKRLFKYLEEKNVKYKVFEPIIRNEDLVVSIKEAKNILKKAENHFRYEEIAKLAKGILTNMPQKTFNEDKLLKLFINVLDFSSDFYTSKENEFENLCIVKGFQLDEYSLSTPAGTLFTLMLRENRAAAGGIVFINEKNDLLY